MSDQLSAEQSSVVTFVERKFYATGVVKARWPGPVN